MRENMRSKSETEYNFINPLCKYMTISFIFIFQFRMIQQKPLEMGVIFNAICEQFEIATRHIRYSEERMEKMYSYPASIDLALIHKNANQFGHIPNSSNRQQAKICPCCQLPINTEQLINITYHTLPKSEQIYYLSAGTSSFFTFIKMAIFYLALRFLISDLFNLITNILGKICQDPSNIDFCSRNILARLSTFNKSTDTDQVYLFIVDILNMVTVVLSIILFAIYRKIQLSIFHFASLLNRSQADYTIFVESIPILNVNQENRQDRVLSDSNYKARLKQLFQKQITEWLDEIDKKQKQQCFENKREYNKLQREMLEIFKNSPNFRSSQPIVTSINLCYDLTQLEQIQNRRQELIQKHKANNQKGISNDQSNNILSQIKELNDQIIQLSIKYAKQSTLQTNNSHFLGKAFISFQYQHYRKYFLEYLKQDISFDDSVKKLTISPAVQPSDVYWCNLKVTHSSRRYYFKKSYVTMLILLLFSFGCLLGLQAFKTQYSINSSSTQERKTTAYIIKGYILTVVMTVATTAINFGLQKAMEKLSVFQKHQTKTNEIISLIYKTVLAQFLNSVVFYYILFQVDNFMVVQHIDQHYDEGLVVNITSLIAISGAIQIFTNLFQFGEIYKNKRNKCKYPLEKTMNLFQIELNKEFQKSEFKFEVRYSYYILNVFVVSFYSYIVPYTSLILIVIFAFQYWVDKYNLFRRYSCPTQFNSGLSMFTLLFFQLSIMFSALGNFIFSLIIHTGSSGIGFIIINIISHILSCAFIFALFRIPKKWLQPFIELQISSLSYKQCTDKKAFKKTYQLQNPATTFANEYNQQSKFASASDLKLIKQYEHRDADHTAQILNKNQPHSNEAMKDSQLPVKERHDL